MQTYIHTPFALQSASVGLAQARPNKTQTFLIHEAMLLNEVPSTAIAVANGEVKCVVELQ